jgi:hypothetical protein
MWAEILPLPPRVAWPLVSDIALSAAQAHVQPLGGFNGP